MLRIHFTDEDLARVRVAAESDPLWEIAFSLQLLHNRQRVSVFGAWRRQAHAQLSRGAALRESTRIVAALISRGRDLATFRIMAAACLGCDAESRAGLKACLSQLPPKSSRAAADCQVPPGEWQVARWEPEMMSRIGAAMRDYYAAFIAPHDGEIQGLIEAQSALQARRVLHGGTEALLGTLCHVTRWRRPVLEVDGHGWRELALGGRGLLLIPSFFCWRSPVCPAGPDLPPTLVFLIDHPSRWLEPKPVTGRRSGWRLAALLGPTRAAVLAAVPVGCTTTELSRRVGISPASASRHAAVLRDAGLVSTMRDANLAIHTVTPLGSAILEKALSGC